MMGSSYFFLFDDAEISMYDSRTSVAQELKEIYLGLRKTNARYSLRAFALRLKVLESIHASLVKIFLSLI